MKNIEVLAPSGNMESLKAAVNSGADAVYLGMGNFNARAKADNFAGDNLKKAVDFAHLHGVKVYVTVNTLVRNDELSSLVEDLKQAVSANVDAFIVQDLLVAKILRECFSNVEMHASTQMGIHNLEGAKIIEKLGFKRVVLSRETTLEDIKVIKAHTNLDIEYFVQGALCVCFSGNCYLSSLLFGKSGNRGECLQPCRLPYKNNLTNETNYYLSARDLCLMKNLKTLIDAGVTSLKIEGRLRRPGYVAESVTEYKKALKNLDSGFDEQAIINLKKVFNRGEYNYDAYLYSNNGGIINPQNQNHIGIEIGKVLNCKKFKDINEIEIATHKKLAVGDGLKFLFNGKEVASLGIGSLKENKNGYTIFTKNKVPNSSVVCLTLDSEMEAKLLNKKDKIPVQISLYAEVGQNLKLEMKQDENIVVLQSDFVCEKTKTKTDIHSIKEKISKLGETDFIAKEINVFGEDFFVPISKINELRRQATEKLEKEILAKYNRKSEFFAKKYAKICEICKKNDNNDLIIAKNIYPFEDKIEDKSTLNILKLDNLSDEYLTKIKTEILDKYSEYNIAINLPIFANYKDIKMIKNMIKFFSKNTKFVANNLYAFSLLNDNIIAGPGLNIYNNISLKEYQKLGAEKIIQSIEIFDTLQNAIYKIDRKNFPLMTFVHCPFKTISGQNCNNCAYQKDMSYKSQTGKVLRIRRYKLSQCYFELTE